jgi:hypothetical protein
LFNLALFWGLGAMVLVQWSLFGQHSGTYRFDSRNSMVFQGSSTIEHSVKFKEILFLEILFLQNVQALVGTSYHGQQVCLGSAGT